jgi:two-component system sensor histidine kinase PhoQ
VIDSLQARLGVATVVVAILFLFSSAAVLDQAFQASERRAMGERMLAQLYVLLSVARVDGAGVPTLPKATDLPQPELAIGDSGLYAFIASGDALLWRSPSSLNRCLPPPPPVAAGQRVMRDIRWDDGQDYALLGYGYAKTTAAGVRPLTFYLLAELAPLQREVATFRQRLWLGVLAVTLLLVATQVVVLRWSLKPLRHIAGELAAIEAGTLQRIEGRYPSEIRQLTTNLNLLLSQERARQDRYRNALADLAHSLKTSLAVLKGAVDHPESLPANVAEQSERMTLIVERQLQRAAMMGNATAVASVAVRPVVERVLASLDKVYWDKGVATDNRVDVGLQFRGDEADLFEVLGNLMDNAYKWCGGRVRVEGRRDGHGLVLIVHDDGPGIAADCVDRIVQRGVRADEAIPGHGIGLAVVADIVEAYQGRMRFGSSPWGGAAVTVEFAL